MAQVLFLAPALVSCPFMGILRVLRATSVEIAVRLLCRSDDIEHRIDISHEFLVGIGLQDIAGTLDCLVRIGVVKGQTTYLKYLRGILQMRCSIREVCVTTCLFTL